jgi:hypothetical protein
MTQAGVAKFLEIQKSFNRTGLLRPKESGRDHGDIAQPYVVIWLISGIGLNSMTALKMTAADDKLSSFGR